MRVSDWEKNRLGDLARFAGGSAFPKSEQGSLEGEHPFIKVSDLSLSVNSRRIVSANNWVSAAQIQFLKVKLMPPYSVVFAKIGEGLKSERLSTLTRPTAIDNNLMAAIPKEGAVDSTFLYYLLGQVRLSEWAQGSALPYLRQSDLERIPVLVPTLEEQRKIAGVLGALDDLIEVNRGLIADLETLAGEFTESEIDKIDQFSRLTDVSVHLAGKYLAKDSYAGGGSFVVHGSNSVMGRHTQFSHIGPLSVLARIGSYCGALVFSEENAWINNNASGIRAKNGMYSYWLHQVLLRINMDRHRAGSGQPFIRINSLLDDEVPWPTLTQIERLNRVLVSSNRAASTLREEIVQLESARDELLPLLMSGRVRVGNQSE